jgi:hypothetical protein
MASLRELYRTLFPTARLVGATELDAERGDREVAWVRVLQTTPPPFEALEPTDLPIVAGTALLAVAPGAAQLESMAASLVAAGVPAVLLVHGAEEPPEAMRALEALGAAVSEGGVAVLDVGSGDARGLERSTIGFLVNRRAEMDRRAADLEAQLARYALLGRGLDVQAAAIAAFLGRPVVIEGRRGDALAVHAPADVPGAAAAVTRYLAGDPARVALRIDLAPPSGQAVPGGRLVLLGEARPSEQERIAAERVAGLLGVELARGAVDRQVPDAAGRREPLPEDGPPWVVLVARQQDGTTTAVEPPDLAVREAIRTELSMLFSNRRLTLRGTSESLEIRAVAAAPADDPEGMGVAARLADRLARTVAVSAPFREPGERPAAEAAARATLEAVGDLADPPRVARASRLAAYLLLTNLRNVPDGPRRAGELLAPVLRARPPVQAERLATLREVLGAASLAEAATRLGVHRNTVAYRIARIERLAGWDLGDPDLRLAVALAVRIVQTAQKGQRQGY